MFSEIIFKIRSAATISALVSPVRTYREEHWPEYGNVEVGVQFVYNATGSTLKKYMSASKLLHLSLRNDFRAASFGWRKPHESSALLCNTHNTLKKGLASVAMPMLEKKVLDRILRAVQDYRAGSRIFLLSSCSLEDTNRATHAREKQQA